MGVNAGVACLVKVLCRCRTLIKNLFCNVKTAVLERENKSESEKHQTGEARSSSACCT